MEALFWTLLNDLSVDLLMDLLWDFFSSFDNYSLIDLSNSCSILVKEDTI